MKKNQQSQSQMSFEDFLAGSTPADAFNKVTEQIIKEESEKLIDEASAKQGEDWSVLANQVVGSEQF